METNYTDSDKLNRVENAESLLELLNLYNGQSLTIGINGSWGAGKSFFLEIVKEKIEDKNVVYIDLFKLDYVDDPLIAILGEMTEILNNDDIKEKSNMLINSIGKGSLKVLGLALESLAKSSGLDLKGALSLLGEFGENQLDEYKRQKENIEDFKNRLKEEAEVRPTVIIVDELDRCQPLFALKSLEVIKHIFDVPNVHFILSYNKQMLMKSLKNVYGDIDSEVYLHKFIPIEFQLPISSRNYETYYTHALTIVGDTLSRKHRSVLLISKKLFIPLYEIDNTSLRSIERLAINMKLYLSKSDRFFSPHLFCFVLYIKVIESNLFLKLLQNKITMIDVISTINYPSIVEKAKLMDYEDAFSRLDNEIKKTVPFTQEEINESEAGLLNEQYTRNDQVEIFKNLLAEICTFDKYQV